MFERRVVEPHVFAHASHVEQLPALGVGEGAWARAGQQGSAFGAQGARAHVQHQAVDQPGAGEAGMMRAP